MNGFKKLALSSTLLLTVILTFAQTGVHFFINENAKLPHAKIVDLIETDNANLVLLSQVSDEKYKFNELNLITYNTASSAVSYKPIMLENLYNLLFIKATDDGYKIFANSSLNKAYQPLMVDFNKNLEKQSSYKEPVVYSTLISDVVEGINYQLILYTKVGKQGKYNISLHKINLVNGKVAWLKKISSEQNEEADKIVISPEGSLFVLGKKYNDAVTEYVPIIYKLNFNGDQIWKKAIDVPNNFSKQSMVISNDNHLIYICGYTKNATGISESRIIKFSDNGEEITNTEITDFSANGILKLTNGNYLAYGSEFFVDQQQIVTKGKYTLLGKNINLLKSKTLDEKDKPDCDLNTKVKTSSDFLIARELSSGYIVLGGKVYTPVNPREKYNVPLLMIINPDGTY